MSSPASLCDRFKAFDFVGHPPPPLFLKQTKRVILLNYFSFSAVSVIKAEHTKKPIEAALSNMCVFVGLRIRGGLD